VSLNFVYLTIKKKLSGDGMRNNRISFLFVLKTAFSSISSVRMLNFLMVLVCFLACFWQETKAVEVDTVWMRQTWDVLSISFHPSSQFFAVGNSGGYVGIWDVNTATEIKKYQGYSSGNVSFSKNGKYLLVTCETPDKDFNNGFKIYDFLNDSLVFSLKTSFNPILKAVLSKDEETVVFGGSNTIEIWNYLTNKRILKYDTSGLGGLMCLDYSPDGTHIAFSDAGSGRKLRFLNVLTNKIENEYPIGQYGKIKYSNDGTKIAYTSPDAGEAIKIMDVNSKQILASIPGYPQGVGKMVFSSDDKYLVYTYGDLHVFDLETKKESYIYDYETTFQNLSISNDKKYFASNAGPYLFLLNAHFETNLVNENLLNINAKLLYPNPTAGSVTLKSEKPISKILLINEAGATIKELDVSQIQICEGQLTFSIDDLSQGFYLCKAIGAGFTETYKIAVVK